MSIPEREASPLAIQLLGPFEVCVHGERLRRLRTRKGEWLLALLTLRRGGDVERRWLAGTLWPDSSESQALASLRKSLGDLRAALGPEASRLHFFAHRTLRLDLTGAMADVVTFDAAVAGDEVAGWERAVGLYRGPLLEGCGEEWVVPEREAREQAYLSTLERLAAHGMERGESAAAVSYLRRAVATDPLRESAQRGLMEALAASGNHASALIAYRELRLRLQQELNAVPAPETAALFERIRSDARRRAQSPPPPGGGAAADGVAAGLGGAEAGPWRRAGADQRPTANGHHPLQQLPVPLTRFIGRERELEEVKHLLSRTRLLTLTGAGGIGKTRVALEVAADLRPGYPHGVWLVELAALSDPELVPQAVAAVMEIREEPERPLTATLVENLHSNTLLLVLDNCEHLLSACAYLAEHLLRHCPNLRVLATSRESLGITGEVTWRVPSLALPGPGVQVLRSSGVQVGDGAAAAPSEIARPEHLNTRTPEHLIHYEAVQLFVERAAAAVPDFALTERNAAAVVQVCCRLDGIPLAIELAAARVKALPVEQIAARLDDRFRLLTAGSRTALPRQQTLRGLIDWSYDLLSEPERSLLRRLSVFAGGWTLEAAEAVCGDCGLRLADCGLTTNEGQSTTSAPRPLIRNPQSAIRNEDVLDLLAQLVGRSLVICEERAGEARYRMLETVRQYAREKLLQSGEGDAVRSRHLDFFTRWSEKAEAASRDRQQARWLEELEREHDNLRAALEWGLAWEGGAEATLRLARAIRDFWSVRGYLTEGRSWLERVLERAGDAHPGLRWDLLQTAAWMAASQGDYAAAQSYGEGSLAISRGTGHEGQIAMSLVMLGDVAADLGDHAAARLYLEQGLALGQKAGIKTTIANALAKLGWEALYQGDLPAARPRFEALLAIRRELGGAWGVSQALSCLGCVARFEGNYAEARALYEEALALGRQIDARMGMGYALADLALVLLKQGDHAAAWSRLEEAMRIFWEVAGKRGMVRVLEGMAQLAWATSQPGRAARVFGAAEALREAISFPLPPVDRADYEAVPSIKAALGAEAFAAAWAEGRTMTLEQAIASVLDAPN